VLDELGVRRRVQIRVTGWLPLPFVVAGTDLVAIVPERLAHPVGRSRAVLAARYGGRAQPGAAAAALARASY